MAAPLNTFTSNNLLLFSHLTHTKSNSPFSPFTPLTHVYIYTWVSGVNGEKGLLDFVCVSWEWRSRLLDVNVLRGAAMGISDHYLVVAKIKVKGGWEKVGGRGRAVEIVRVERLEDEEKRSEYTRGIREKWEEVGGSEVEGVEEEWSKLKGALVEVARRVCGR